MGKLVLHIPGGGMRDIPLDDGRITLGRRADNDVCLPYPAVSAEHAAIVTVLDDSFLEDMQSTNGTLVNGKRVAKHFLRDRDAIDVGRVQLVYLVDDDEVIAPLDAEASQAAASSSEQPTGADSPPDRVGSHVDDRPVRGSEDRERAPVDDLLAELMGTTSNATVAIDIPPPVALVAEPLSMVASEREARSDATSGVYIEVMNGPNAGQIVPMTKREFVLGHKGATRAVIHRDEDRFYLVAVDAAALISINGTPLLNERSALEVGDTIDVAGVMLRFGQRPPL